MMMLDVQLASEEDEVCCDELVEKLDLFFQFKTKKKKGLDEAQLNCLKELISEISTCKLACSKFTNTHKM